MAEELLEARSAFCTCCYGAWILIRFSVSGPQKRLQVKYPRLCIQGNPPELPKCRREESLIGPSRYRLLSGGCCQYCARVRFSEADSSMFNGQ